MESVLVVDAPYEGLGFRIPKPIQSLISCLRLFGALLRFGLRAQGGSKAQGAPSFPNKHPKSSKPFKPRIPESINPKPATVGPKTVLHNALSPEANSPKYPRPIIPSHVRQEKNPTWHLVEAQYPTAAARCHHRRPLMVATIQDPSMEVTV